MRVAPTIFVSTHAKKQAESRDIPKSTFWAADREARRTGLKDKLITQHQKLFPMLTDKKILFRIDDRLCKASKDELTTRMVLDGITLALGIRRVGDDYSPLTCLTAWN